MTAVRCNRVTTESRAVLFFKAALPLPRKVAFCIDPPGDHLQVTAELMLRFLLPAVILVLLLPTLIFLRGYPWQLALLSALAVSGLAYSILRTIENMRTLLRGEGPDTRKNS